MNNKIRKLQLGDYFLWNNLSREDKVKRNKQIAKLYLDKGPSILNYYNALKAYFGGFNPKNPYLITGEAPSPGWGKQGVTGLHKMMAKLPEAKLTLLAPLAGRSRAATIIKDKNIVEALKHRDEVYRRWASLYKQKHDPTPTTFRTKPAKIKRQETNVANSNAKTLAGGKGNAGGSYSSKSHTIRVTTSNKTSAKNLEDIAFHEGIHSYGLGESPSYVWKSKYLNFPEGTNPYFLDPREIATHGIQQGQNLGIKVGQTYPGREAMIKMIENRPEGLGFGGVPMILYNNAKTNSDYRRLWSLLNGTFKDGGVIIAANARKWKHLEGGQIRKMLTAAGGPLFPWLLNTEWVDNWKFRTTPASRSRVLSGKGVETDKQYTERRKKETTKRTWRSDAADVAHGIGEGVLALNPYTAIPYFGAKVGLDFLNGTYGWHTALNASVPLFHLSPQINQNITSATNYSEKMLSKYIPELSYKVNKNKILDERLFGTKVGEGSEVKVYRPTNSSVYKVSKEGTNLVSDVYKYMESRLRRNSGPYVLKENIEGIVLKEGKYYPATSLKYYEPKNSLYPSEETQQIQDLLMLKKGYYRVPIEEIPNLPGASVINSGKPMYTSSSAFTEVYPSSKKYSLVFSNGKNYIIDNRLGRNSILNKNWFGKYKLVQRDNDVIPLSGKNKGYFPLGDKTFNPYISDNTYTPEQMENFKNLFISRYGNSR